MKHHQKLSKKKVGTIFPEFFSPSRTQDSMVALYFLFKIYRNIDLWMNDKMYTFGGGRSFPLTQHSAFGKLIDNLSKM